jgi:hypothetical protein
MDNCVTLIENHVTRFHRHIVRSASVIIDFDGPGLVDFLIDLDNAGGDERQAIDIYE